MIDYFAMKVVNPYPPHTRLSVRCPTCRHVGIFEPLTENMNDASAQQGETPYQGHWITGQRRCPNPDCAALLFFVVDGSSQKIKVTFPTERIDFDLTEVPQGVAVAIEEALVCHSTSCFIAASMMIRKTLEEICHDRGAKGKDLFARIEALANTVVLPQGYLEGLHNLRLLGNDGAHIESRHYSQVDEEEVEVGIEVLKDIVRAVYQQASTMERLRALRSDVDKSVER